MDKKIRIILAIEDELSRLTLRAFLNAEDDLHVVATAATEPEILRLLKKIDTDLILLETTQTRLRFSEVLSLVRLRYPQVKVIILSAINDDGFIKDLFLEGISSYLLKPYSSGLLLQTIQKVYEKGFWLEQSLVKDLLTIEAASVVPGIFFTEREKEIYKLILKGLKSKEIAERLFCSVSAVNFHRRNLNQKTGSHSSAQLVWFAREHNLFLF